jgi:hypothetical protein
MEDLRLAQLYRGIVSPVPKKRALDNTSTKLNLCSQFYRVIAANTTNKTGISSMKTTEAGIYLTYLM